MDKLIEYFNEHIETNEPPKELTAKEMKICVKALEHYKSEITVSDLLTLIND